MKKNCLIILSLFFAHFLFSQNENADAIFEKFIKEFTLEADGSTSYREYKQLKLITQFSFNRLYGETFIIYNPEFQNLKINDAYTVMADGSKVITPPNAFNEVLPRDAAFSATANHMKEMVVTHTATEMGATIFLDYTLTSAKGYLPGFMGNVLIQESSPIAELEVIVRIPSDQELNHRMIGLRTGPEIKIEANQKVYVWKFNGVQASPKEPLQGKYQLSAPRLLFTTAIGVAETINWLTNQQAFELQINDEMKAWTDNLRSKQTEEIETLMTIQKAVVENIVFERYNPEWLAYRARTPEEIWKSNGGNKLEKTLLLATLLKYANFNATPAIVGPKSLFDEKAINLTIFDDFVLIVNTKSFGTIYMSAVEISNQSLEYSLAQNIFIPLSKGISRAPVEPVKMDNKINIKGTISFNEELKPSGTMEVELTGANNPFLLLQNDKGKFKSLISNKMIKDDDAISIKNSNVAKSELLVKVESTESISDNNGYYSWQLPVITGGFEKWRIAYLDKTRQSNLFLPYPIVEKYSYTITLPLDYTVINKRFNERLKNNVGTVSVEIKPKGNQIEINRELKLNTQMIYQIDYNEFRDMINFWLDKNLSTVVFKKKD
ncbi:MAG TPA: DUF3858 domain-containing protein [Bacteroidales bacterium]|nr:DUF3858 domain-containing protein [Bacteroidales bacterium]HOG66074.1 DUF3858 domain-containing protein [Bacteroidales bacterium]HPA12039.1 DUF3858 domain-containing protein [Bacteroidales bacterium]HQO06520.1 DUF3858 domain-containing protein [Bacteroidales bacterium]HQP53079.1 DUF3858 domain-containing protein [Bacteroidales bacterium]